MRWWVIFILSVVSLVIIASVVAWFYIHSHFRYGENLGNICLSLLTHPSRVARHRSRDPLLDRMYEQINAWSLKYHSLRLTHWLPSVTWGADAWQYSKEHSRQWEDDSWSNMCRNWLLRVTPDVPSVEVACHLRLGDVPFGEWKRRITSAYHFQSYEFWKWAWKRLNLHPPQRIHIVYSVAWKSNEVWKRDSYEYLNRLVSMMKEHGFDVILQSKTALEDFSTLLRAKKLIGSCGSFSFLSALGRWDQVAMPQLGLEQKDGEYEIRHVPEWMSPHRPILRTEFEKQSRTYHHPDDVWHMTYDQFQ